MVFNVTENLCYYIVQLVFKIKKYLLSMLGGLLWGFMAHWGTHPT
jgi:hypothetical protein